MRFTKLYSRQEKQRNKKKGGNVDITIWVQGRRDSERILKEVQEVGYKAKPSHSSIFSAVHVEVSEADKENLLRLVDLERKSSCPLLAIFDANTSKDLRASTPGEELEATHKELTRQSQGGDFPITT